MRDKVVPPDPLLPDRSPPLSLRHIAEFNAEKTPQVSTALNNRRFNRPPGHPVIWLGGPAMVRIAWESLVFYDKHRRIGYPVNYEAV